MNIQDVPVVKIDSDGGYKFIVAIVKNSAHETKFVIRADQRCGYHFQIEKKLVDEIGTELKARVIGGGNIFADSKKKIIEICGKSAEFGKEPDRELTLILLHNFCTGFDVSERK